MVAAVVTVSRGQCRHRHVQPANAHRHRPAPVVQQPRRHDHDPVVRAGQHLSGTDPGVRADRHDHRRRRAAEHARPPLPERPRRHAGRARRAARRPDERCRLQRPRGRHHVLHRRRGAVPAARSGPDHHRSVPADELRVRRPVPGARPQRLRRRHRAVGLRRHQPQRRLEPVRRRRHPDGQRQPQGRLEPVDRHLGDRPALSLRPAGLRRAGHGHRRRPGARRPGERRPRGPGPAARRPVRAAGRRHERRRDLRAAAAGQPGPGRRGRVPDVQHARRQPGLAADRHGPARADAARRSAGRSDRGTSTRPARHPTSSARPPPTPPASARRSRSSTAPTPTGSGGCSS